MLVSRQPAGAVMRVPTEGLAGGLLEKSWPLGPHLTVVARNTIKFCGKSGKLHQFWWGPNKGPKWGPSLAPEDDAPATAPTRTSLARAVEAEPRGRAFPGRSLGTRERREIFDCEVHLRFSRFSIYALPRGRFKR